jgi:hypothetical protein
MTLFSSLHVHIREKPRQNRGSRVCLRLGCSFGDGQSLLVHPSRTVVDIVVKHCAGAYRRVFVSCAQS